MNAVSKKDVETTCKSYLNWWRDAGVDSPVSAESKNWLAKAAKPSQPRVKPIENPDRPNRQPASEHSKTETPASLDRAEWPKDIATLTQMLADKAQLPGNHYGGNPAIPSTISAPKFMLIGDIPDTQNQDSGTFSNGPNGDLIKRMVKAIGISPDEYVYTGMATTRPATGALPESDYPLLAEFMMHQTGLFKPEKAIIFGSAACQALLGADMMDKRGSLHYFNHNGQKVTAVTTFHPRTLLARPQMKRQAWKDLQVVIK